MQNEFLNEYSIKQETNENELFHPDEKFTEYLQSYFYEVANNAINEIDLIYSENSEEKDYSKEILIKIFKNILEHPGNDKYLKFKLSNKILQKIINFQSVLDLLFFVGFKKIIINGEEYLVLNEYDKQIFSTIYSFVLLLNSGNSTNSIYNSEGK